MKQSLPRVYRDEVANTEREREEESQLQFRSLEQQKTFSPQSVTADDDALVGLTISVPERMEREEEEAADSRRPVLRARGFCSD